MCGRYTLINLAYLTDLFPWITEVPEAPPRYNIAPTQPILAVANHDKSHLHPFLWGLIPFWAKDPSIGSQMCNARAETLAEKNSYKHAFKRRRCLIPADGFYEWKHVPGSKTKQPMYIRMKSGKPFAFAGLWETWNSDDGSQLKSCTIITTNPNSLIEPIHNRMPAIIRPEHHERWLDPVEKSPQKLTELLSPHPASEMEVYPISTQVNNVRNESPDLIKRTDPVATSLFD
ncbi:MAG TPA: SOS response-associated peptidase [Tepidisphaeraceae bacterium]|jgi:putative SOS response-associated peptidase YedK